jgi:hypothetical protein
MFVVKIVDYLNCLKKNFEERRDSKSRRVIMSTDRDADLSIGRPELADSDGPQFPVDNSSAPAQRRLLGDLGLQFLMLRVRSLMQDRHEHRQKQSA